MLFDAASRALIGRYCVPVITDAPWSARRPRRNAALWDRSEGWKSKPLIEEIVLLVTADEQRVARGAKSRLGDPELLQRWLLETASGDGLEVARGDWAAVAVRQRLRAAARALFAGEQTPHGRARHRAVRALADAASARELCADDGAEALWTALERDDARDRAAAKVLVYRLDEVATSICGEAEGARAFLLAALRGGRLATCEQLYAAAACLRVAVRQALAARPADAPALDDEVQAELAALGLR